MIIQQGGWGHKSLVERRLVLILCRALRASARATAWVRCTREVAIRIPLGPCCVHAESWTPWPMVPSSQMLGPIDWALWRELLKCLAQAAWAFRPEPSLLSNEFYLQKAWVAECFCLPNAMARGPEERTHLLGWGHCVNDTSSNHSKQRRNQYI